MAILLNRQKKFSNDEFLQMLRGAKKEREKALKILYTDCQLSFNHYLAQNGGTDEDGKEILQQILVKLVEKAMDGDFPELKNIKGYLFTACKNHWLNSQRVASRLSSLTPLIIDKHAETAIDPYRLLENKDTRKSVNEILELLGGKCKNLLLWSLGEGMDMKSIAQELNYENVQTAMNIKARCKKKLKSLVGGHQIFQQLVYQVIHID